MVVLAGNGIGHAACTPEVRIDYPWRLQDEPCCTGETPGGRREKYAKIKILPRISVTIDRFCVVGVVGVVVVTVVNGSLDLASRAIVLQAFLFD
jgi:hypothetical protein